MKFFSALFSALFLLSAPIIEAKIVADDAFARQLQTMNDAQLQKEFDSHRAHLMAPTRNLSIQMEKDVAEAQTPGFKMKRLNAIIAEIGRRCRAAKSPAELSRLTDRFYR